MLPQRELFSTKRRARRSYHTGICHTCMRTRVLVYTLITDSGYRTAIVEVDTGMAFAKLRKSTLSAPPFLHIFCIYLVFQHPRQYYKGLIAEQMAVMIHHFSAIQKQQLLCWQFMECGIMFCKMIPFSWKAASENNPCNLGKNR